MRDPQKERRKVSTTVYLTVEQLDALRLLSQNTKVPIAEFIREGVNLILARYQDLLPGQIQLIPEESPPSTPRSGVIEKRPGADVPTDTSASW